MTESLLEKIEEHPLLSRALRDPTLAQALSQFQTDPESVLRTAAGNPQLQEVLKEFCSLMGTHLTDLADRQDSEKHGKSIYYVHLYCTWSSNLRTYTTGNQSRYQTMLCGVVCVSLCRFRAASKGRGSG